MSKTSSPAPKTITEADRLGIANDYRAMRDERNMRRTRRIKRAVRKSTGKAS